MPLPCAPAPWGPAMSAAAVMTAGRPRRPAPPLTRLEPLLYLSPALVLLALVMFVPLLVGLSYAFRNIQLFNPFATGWVGLAHFDELIHDAAFWHALFDTVWWTGGSLVFQFSFGLILALALVKPFFGRRLVQAIVFV